MDPKNIQKLVEMVTAEVMQRIKAVSEKQKILVLGKDPACPIAACLRQSFEAEVAPNLERAANYDFAVLPTWYIEKLQSEKPLAKTSAPPVQGECLDYRGRRLLHERELRERCSAAVKMILVSKDAIITSLATDYVRQRGISVRRED